jgi:hypothetical protein
MFLLRRRIVFNWVDADESDLARLNCILIVLESFPEILKFMFSREKANLTMSSDEIIKNSKTFSEGEQLLIRVALDFWDGSGNPHYNSLIHNLSDTNFENVIKATTLMRKI